MTNEERKHFEELKNKVPDETITIVSIKKIQKNSRWYNEVLYSNGTKQLIPTYPDCCAMGTGCRNNIPFNPNNNNNSYDFTWERDKINEQGGEYND